MPHCWRRAHGHRAGDRRQGAAGGAGGQARLQPGRGPAAARGLSLRAVADRGALHQRGHARRRWRAFSRTRCQFPPQASGGGRAQRGDALRARRWPVLPRAVFLDADNRVGPHMLRRAFDALADAAPEIGWVYPDFDLFGIAGAWSTAGSHHLLQHLSRECLAHAAVLVRRRAEAGVAFDASLKAGFEDWDFFLRAADAGFRRHLPKAGFLHPPPPREHAAATRGARARRCLPGCRRAIPAVRATPHPGTRSRRGAALRAVHGAGRARLPRPRGAGQRGAGGSAGRPAGGRAALGACMRRASLRRPPRSMRCAMRAAARHAGACRTPAGRRAAVPGHVYRADRAGARGWAGDRRRADDRGAQRRAACGTPDALAGMAMRGLSASIPAVAPPPGGALEIAQAGIAAFGEALGAAPAARANLAPGCGWRAAPGGQARRAFGPGRMAAAADGARSGAARHRLRHAGLRPAGRERVLACLGRRARGRAPTWWATAPTSSRLPAAGCLRCAGAAARLRSRHGGGRNAYAGAATSWPRMRRRRMRCWACWRRCTVVTTHAFAGHCVLGGCGAWACGPPARCTWPSAGASANRSAIRTARWPMSTPTTCSSRFAPAGHLVRGSGRAGEKIVALRDAPGYPGDAERIAKARAARQGRARGGRLRALVLGRLDSEGAGRWPA